MKKILQAFRKIFPEKEPVYYICDPERAKGCAKGVFCWWNAKGPCKCTRHKKYAKRDSDGKRIVARPLDLFNDDYLDYRIMTASTGSEAEERV